MTQQELEDQLAVLMGGRAAEEIHYGGVISTGAANDLERASELARQMVMRFGMSERLGKMTYGRPQGAQFLKTILEHEDRNYSDETARAIDEESERFVDAAFAGARRILAEKTGPLERIANTLVTCETLYRLELEVLIGEPLPQPRAEAMRA